MTLASQSLVMLVLMVCAAVVVVPAQLLTAAPRLSPPLRAGLKQPGLWLVQNPGGEWFLNGHPRSRGELARVLPPQARNQTIHFLPSDALPLNTVATSLRWLRASAPGSVVLELPPQGRPSR